MRDIRSEVYRQADGSYWTGWWSTGGRTSSCTRRIIRAIVSCPFCRAVLRAALYSPQLVAQMPMGHDGKTVDDSRIALVPLRVALGMDMSSPQYRRNIRIAWQLLWLVSV